MKNPWNRKNPFLSMWLSGANAIVGSVRGHATAYAKRKMAAAVTQNARQVTDFWTNALAASTKLSRRRKRR